LRRDDIKQVSDRVVDSKGDPLGTRRSLIVRDPDGHALEFLEERTETNVSAINRK
jgi:hypothetical protein